MTKRRRKRKNETKKLGGKTKKYCKRKNRGELSK